MNFFSFLLALFCGSALWAGSALPLTVQDLARSSARIFVGRCEASSVELDEYRLPTRSVSYQVQTAIRGVEAGERVRLKEIAAQSTLDCQPGEAKLLFLYGESQLGFTSAVGLGQGRFEIETGADGVQRVSSRFPHLAAEIGNRPVSTLVKKVQKWVSDEK